MKSLIETFSTLILAKTFSMEFWEEIIIAVFIVILNFVITPLIKSLYAKFSHDKQLKDEFNKAVDEVEQKIEDKLNDKDDKK